LALLPPPPSPRAGYSTREHIGLWRATGGSADNGKWGDEDATLKLEWTLVSRQPLFGWGGGSERNCTDTNRYARALFS
jgi:hypothetical protein